MRECLEEASIEVELKGVLRVDHSVKNDHAKMRVIFYAEPTSLEMCEKIKTVADTESEEARWVTIQEIHELGKTSPGLRGEELIEWAAYLERGGQVWPLSMFGKKEIGRAHV